MIYYFSGCGNSRFIAESIAQALNEPLVFIPEAEREGNLTLQLAQGERLGFVFPIYSWRPPQLVMDFVKKLKADCGSAPDYIWMAATCGDNGGYADRVFAKQLKEALGLPLHAAFCFEMPNTYINMSFMGVDKPAVAQRKIGQAKAKLPEVIRDITGRKAVWQMRRGIFPCIKTYGIGRSFYKWVTDEPFHSTDACISCGRCVQACPLQNITLEEGRPRWQGHCTNCDACFHHCPKNAIQFGTASVGKGQYYFGIFSK
ncbi:MAG: EFR1 family ferrodoxin [Bacteroidales bacterium]|nr:EFR1 family ferrodoxin [Bacteroidales bacterium]